MFIYVSSVIGASPAKLCWKGPPFQHCAGKDRGILELTVYEGNIVCDPIFALFPPYFAHSLPALFFARVLLGLISTLKYLCQFLRVDDIAPLPLD